MGQWKRYSMHIGLSAIVHIEQPQYWKHICGMISDSASNLPMLKRDGWSLLIQLEPMDT